MPSRPTRSNNNRIVMRPPEDRMGRLLLTVRKAGPLAVVARLLHSSSDALLVIGRAILYIYHMNSSSYYGVCFTVLLMVI